jgi:hypothetical protein
LRIAGLHSRKIVREKLVQEKLVQEKLAQEKLAQEKLAQERFEQERFAQERFRQNAGCGRGLPLSCMGVSRMRDTRLIIWIYY